ncbi:hypothetical protein, partial [Neisseria meningitidis]|uniref:hypothetical protein n=1 Tax=Neisseria meningitidis TaxID=487 RepID=UPI001C99E470
MYCSRLPLPLWMAGNAKALFIWGISFRLKLRIGGLLCWDAVYHCLACILYVWQEICAKV